MGERVLYTMYMGKRYREVVLLQRQNVLPLYRLVHQRKYLYTVYSL